MALLRDGAGLALLAATRALATGAGARLAGLVADRPPPRLELALESRLPEDSRPLDDSRLPDDSRLLVPPVEAEVDFDAESLPPDSALALSDLAPSGFEASTLDVESAFVEDGSQIHAPNLVVHLPNANAVRTQLPANDEQNVL